MTRNDWFTGDELLTLWIEERNKLARQISKAEEPSIKAALEIKLDRLERAIDSVLSHNAGEAHD